jgi:site-specific DNA recombinase
VESGYGLAGFNVPFGYRFEQRKLAVIPDEGVQVHSVFSAYLDGMTLDQIAWGLNCESIRTKRGMEWTKWSISRMLHNPIYAGFLRWDGLITPSDHEPIVTKETYNSVQARMSSRTKRRVHRSHAVLLDRTVAASA